ncbi:hypothetical protein N7453_006838 [Penicillium expansum]|nr:hypothetical protein N7453_006838 [Penicillium expansum]
MPLPPSPLKLSHRYPSASEDSPISPGTTGNTFVLESPRSPRTPRLSAPPSPIASRHTSNAMSGSHRESGDFSGAVDAGGGGLGNLADELADAWGEEEDGYGYASGQEASRAGSQQMGHSDGEDMYMQSAHSVRSRSPSLSPERDSLHPSRNKNRANHLRQHRRQESQYDGSDYGPDSDLEEADISPALESQLAEIESLVRRGIENNGSENDRVIQRTVESLKDLGGQSGIENSAMRLITAHSSITSHLTHQTRALQSLVHPLLFSPFPLLSEDAIDSLMPLIDEGLLPNLPYPFPEHQDSQSTAPPVLRTKPPGLSPSPHLANSRYHTHTSWLKRHTLRVETIDVNCFAPNSSLISGGKKSREEGSRWIERGEWDRRLKDREAGKVCGDVVSGFEAVCGEWRGEAVWS